MIRLIVSDLDGTLLMDHNTIHPDNVAALREAERRGIRFAVASGRSADSCSRVLLKSGLADTPILAANGCHVLDRPFGSTVESHFLQRKTAMDAIGLFSSLGLDHCLYTLDAIVWSSEETLEEHEEGFRNGSRMTFLSGADAMLHAAQTLPMKLFCMLGEGAGQREAFETAKRVCLEMDGVEVTSSWHNNFELMPAGVNKGAAVRSLARRLAVDRSEVMTFGDCDNDLPMLLWAGHGVAMGNAGENIRRSAAYVTGPNTDGGVAQGIYRWALGGCA